MSAHRRMKRCAPDLVLVIEKTGDHSWELSIRDGLLASTRRSPVVLLALLSFLAKPTQERDSAATQQERQGQEQPSDARARIRSTVELVVVPVTVKDSKGNLVDDLRKDDFRIFEDDVEQQTSTLFDRRFSHFRPWFCWMTTIPAEGFGPIAQEPSRHRGHAFS